MNKKRILLIQVDVSEINNYDADVLLEEMTSCIQECDATLLNSKFKIVDADEEVQERH